MSKQNEIQRDQKNKTLRNKTSKNFKQIRNWADEKGIYKSGDLKTQFLKLISEAGELADAILDENEQEIIDGIGDNGVVLTNLAELTRLKFNPNNENNGDMFINIENCIGSSYDTIKNRQGEMINGTFVKEIPLCLPEDITNIVEVHKFIIELYEKNKLFHFDDSVFDIIGDDEEIFTLDEMNKIDKLVNKCFKVCNNANINIHEIVYTISQNESI